MYSKFYIFSRKQNSKQKFFRIFCYNCGEFKITSQRNVITTLVNWSKVVVNIIMFSSRCKNEKFIKIGKTKIRH